MTAAAPASAVAGVPTVEAVAAVIGPLPVLVHRPTRAAHRAVPREIDGVPVAVAHISKAFR